jgi:SAM-dependent methyltransferase
MASRVPDRIAWAVDVLRVGPADRLLEIGCGTGVALELVCDRLGDGQIKGIDRSAKAITAAERRNSRHLQSGRARLLHTTLADASLGGQLFDKIFAVNVNVFWLGPARELQVVRSLLAPRGRLYLFYEPPSPAQVTRVIDACTRFLQEEDFLVTDVLGREPGLAPGLCLVAAPAK